MTAPIQLDCVTLDVQAKAALAQAGYTKPEAAAAVAAARAHVCGDIELSALIREALRRCRKPG